MKKKSRCLTRLDADVEIMIIDSFEDIDVIVKRRLEVLLSQHRCNMCFGNFNSVSVLSGEGHSLFYSNKQFFSVFSKGKSRKPIVEDISAPLISRHITEPKSVFVRKTIATTKPRRLGNSIILLLNCSQCSNDMKTEINVDNLTNFCSK